LEIPWKNSIRSHEYERGLNNWADQIYNNGFSDENRTQKIIDILKKHGAKTRAQLALKNEE
jgi:hypothetical protein